MKASYFPKALLYREWREGRLVYILAAVLTCLPGISAVLTYMSIPTKGPNRIWALQSYWQNFYNDTTTFHGHAFPSLFFVVIWVAVPILRITPERGRGSLTMLLTTPVKRTDWLRVKFWFGLTTLALSSAIWFVLLWLLHFQAPAAAWTPTNMVASEVGIHFIVYASFYAMATFIGICVTNTMAAVLVCFGVTLAPLWLTTVLQEIFPNIVYGTSSGVMNPMDGLAVPHGTWMYLVQWASPINMLNTQIGFTWRNAWLYWYLALVPIVYAGSMQYFRHMRAGEFQNLLTRKSLWYWMLTGISVVIGSGIGGSVASQPAFDITYVPERHAAIFTASFILSSSIIWLAAWAFFFVREQRRRLRDSRSSSRGKGAKAW